MNTLRLGSSVLLFGIAALTSACVHAPTAAMPNPLSAGSVGENELRYADRQSEQQLGLPLGTLEYSASLASADDRELCFHVKLRTARRDLATPKNWRAFLRGKPSFEDMAPRFKDIDRISEETVAGSTLLSSQSNHQICDDEGHCYNQTITHSTRIPQDIKVLSGGGTVCFANAGHLTKSTEEITLHMDDPNPPSAGMWTGLMNRVAFRWKFN